MSERRIRNVCANSRRWLRLTTCLPFRVAFSFVLRAFGAVFGGSLAFVLIFAPCGMATGMQVYETTRTGRLVGAGCSQGRQVMREPVATRR